MNLKKKILSIETVALRLVDEGNVDMDDLVLKLIIETGFSGADIRMVLQIMKREGRLDIP